MKSILITGSSRGIGLELVKQLVVHDSAPEITIASCRKPQEAKDLQELAKQHKAIRILELDTTRFESYAAFIKKLDALLGDDGLNVLVNNAGIICRKQIDELNPEDLTSVYLTNTIAPIILTKTLLPYLQKAAEKNQTLPFGVHKAAVINITSILGSISLNTDGGYAAHRESKAALNTATRSWSYKLKEFGILVAAIHPGWVQTDMGGTEGQISVTDSVRGVIKTVLALDGNQNGAFLQYDGNELAW